MRSLVAPMLLLAGLLAACSSSAPPLPYKPAVQPAGASVSAAYTIVNDRLRVEVESGGKRLERAQIVKPDGTLLEAQTIEYTPASGGGGWGGSPISLGLGVGGFSGGGGGGGGVASGVGVSTGGVVGGGGGGSGALGSSIASFPLTDAGPRPWRVRVKLVGVEPAEILVGDP